MKISGPHLRSGSVLLATMIFVLAIAAFLVTYLYVVQNSNQSVARAQRWNAALAIAEGGIEEGMAKLNMEAVTLVPGAGGFTDVLERDLNGGTYAVGNISAGVVQTLTSTGTVTAPITGDIITRTVRVTAQRQGLFTKGMISMTDIDMNGNKLILGSFNSHDPAQSQNGHFDPNLPLGTNGDIASVNGVVDLGNHWINGNLYLGPYSTFGSGPKGGVSGTIYTDWNMQFPNVSMPYYETNGDPITWVAAPGNTSDHTFTNSGHYLITDSGNITVYPGVTVILDVKQTSYQPSSLNIMGDTTNAGSVIMYQESGYAKLGGSSTGGAFNNRPENFVYFGLPSVTEIDMGGGVTFVGVIYAPQAKMKLNGGSGNNTYNYIGSLVVNSLTIDGSFSLIYDTSLFGYFYGYYVAGYWEEL